MAYTDLDGSKWLDLARTEGHRKGVPNMKSNGTTQPTQEVLARRERIVDALKETPCISTQMGEKLGVPYDVYKGDLYKLKEAGRIHSVVTTGRVLTWHHGPGVKKGERK
jgi:hypothetical protein